MRPTRVALVALAVAAFFAPRPVHAGADEERRVVARVDPRVELLGAVFRLAGNPEYAQGRVPSYAQAVDARFGKLRDHAVVRHAAALRRDHGVGYDAVMSLAVHLDADFRLAAPKETERLDSRWPAADAKAFAEELRAFAQEGKAAEFFESQRELYALTAQRMQSVLDEHLRLAWFDAFFGGRPTATFELALGLGNGGGCYGPSVKRAGGTEELHCVLGVWTVDAEGRPVFGEDVIPAVVHEFCHSYCNALVDGHLSELCAPAQSLWPEVADAMRDQAYADWKTMMRESLVRACVTRYQFAAGGADAARREAEAQHDRMFPWTGELSDLLAEYEKTRAEHPTLDAFMPRIAAFFADYAKRRADEEQRAPKVKDIVPGNGAEDVDPATAAIVITFDRPMMDQSWAVVGGGPRLPKMTGKPRYDDARRVLTIPVALQPGSSYEFWLNRGKYDSFRSAEGVKLRSVHVTFATRKD
jgi:hypothetical protein